MNIEKEHGPRYWLDRFPYDSKLIDEGTKQRLIKAFYTEHLGLDTKDIDFFFNPDTIPNAQKPDEALRFASIEQLVGRAYDSGPSQWSDREYTRRSKVFLTKFRTILENFYTEGELDEIIGYMDKRSEGFLVVSLLGENHIAVRRTRNAYLPMITSLVQLGGDVEGQDLTYMLFDGELDAVDQIERLIKGTDTID